MVKLAALTALFGQAFAFQRPITRDDVLRPPEAIVFTPWQEVSQLEHGTEYLETFPSPVSTGDPKNDAVPLRIFLPTNATGPVHLVLIAHYWGATDLKAESALASNMNERGLAAAILTLPYHMERTPDGAKSGMLAIQPDPALLSRMMYQSEQDARRAFDFLDTRKELVHDSYGFAGISLGALVAALSFAVDTRVTFATFALGGGDFAHIVWNSSRVAIQKDMLRRNGWTESKLRTALDSVEPLNYLPKTGESKSLVIEAKFDSVMPKQCTEELVAKLKSPKILRLETGHYGGIFEEGKILRTVADFFSAEMNGRNFAVPAHFSSLTLRLGGLVGFPQGADLGAGIDIFHLDPAGTRFGTVFITPRGPRLFLGQSLGYGIFIRVGRLLSRCWSRSDVEYHPLNSFPRSPKCVSTRTVRKSLNLKCVSGVVQWQREIALS